MRLACVSASDSSEAARRSAAAAPSSAARSRRSRSAMRSASCSSCSAACDPRGFGLGFLARYSLLRANTCRSWLHGPAAPPANAAYMFAEFEETVLPWCAHNT